MSSIQTITPLAQQALPATPSVPVGTAGTVTEHLPGRDAAVTLNISPSSRLQSGRDNAIALGNRARAADATFERALALVQDMKTQLGAITKQFPPFANDDNERVRYLNNFSGLRKQVESLTFPPEPKAAGAWAQVRFPAERLDVTIPDLDPANASDADIVQAEDQLGRIGADLTRQRESLYDSVMAALGGSAEADQALVLAQAVRARLAA